MQFVPNDTVDIDLIRFWSLTDALDRGAVSNAILERAVTLYRGSFLDGLLLDECPAFEHWSTVLRGDIDQRAGRTLFYLAQRYARAGRHTDALMLLRRHLELNELNEEAHRLLMQTLMLLGERGAALAHYQHLCRLLKSELAMEPEPATQAVFQDIQRGGQVATILTETPAPPPIANQSLPVPICVGRDRQLAQLDAVLRQMLQTGTHAVFLIGEAGIGKTTILQAFLQRVRRLHPEFKVGYSLCTAHLTNGEHFQGFAGVLRSLFEGYDDGVHPAGYRTAPSAAVLGVEPQELPPPVASDWSGRAPILPATWFEQVFVFLQQLAAQTPIVLVVDNLQWADAPTIALLLHLAQQLRSARVLLLGAYRPTDEGDAAHWHTLRAAVDELAGSSVATLIDLDTVENDEVMNAMLDLEMNRLGVEFRSKLMKHTEGHPLFMAELLRTLREQGGLVRDADGYWIEHLSVDWEQLPPRVSALIDKSILCLTPEARRLLDTASAEGDEFTAEVLARVHDLPVRIVIDLLSRELAGRYNLVLPLELIDNGGLLLSRYRFRHHWVKRYVYTHLDAAERAQVHKALGQVLETHFRALGRFPANMPLRLAQHFELAKERNKAIAYWRLAGEQLVAQGLFSEALASLTRALHLVDAEDRQNAFDLLLAREQIYDLLANRDGQARDLAELQRLASVTARTDWRARVHLRCANLAEATARYSSALAEARAAVSLAHTSGDIALKAEALRLAGRSTWWQGALQRSRYYYVQACSTAEKSGVIPLYLDCLIHLGIAYWSLDEIENARMCFQRVENEAEAASIQAIAAQLGYGMLATAVGHFSEAEFRLASTLELSVKSGWLWMEMQVRLHLAKLLRCTQQFDRFFANYATLLQQCIDTGDRWAMAAALAEAAAAYYSLGAWDIARSLAHTASERASEIGAELIVLLALNTLAQVYLDTGDLLMADQITQRSIRLATRIKTPGFMLSTLLVRSITLRSQQRYDEALAALAHAYQVGWNDVTRRYLPALLAAQAAIALEQGELTTAQNLVEGLLISYSAIAVAQTENPSEIYLTCLRVLRAECNPWSALALTRAYQFIQIRAASITDDEHRRSFQEMVPAHREIIAQWHKEYAPSE